MIRKKIKYLYKVLIQKFFFFLYGKVSVSKLKINKSDSRILNPRNNSKYKIYEIEYARIFTDNNENLAVIKDNKIIPQMSFQQVKGELKNAKFNSVTKKGTNSFAKNISASLGLMT